MSVNLVTRQLKQASERTKIRIVVSLTMIMTVWAFIAGVVLFGDGLTTIAFGMTITAVGYSFYGWYHYE